MAGKKKRLAKGYAARQARSVERRSIAFEMRKKGATYREIGEKLGISTMAACNHVRAVLTELEEQTKEDARDLVKMELYRLDQMLLGLFEKAIAGKETAVDRVLKIMERRARLIGLDAPKRQEVTGADGGEIQISGLGGLLNKLDDKD